MIVWHGTYRLLSLLHGVGLSYLLDALACPYSFVGKDDAE